MSSSWLRASCKKLRQTLGPSLSAKVSENILPDCLGLPRLAILGEDRRFKGGNFGSGLGVFEVKGESDSDLPLLVWTNAVSYFRHGATGALLKPEWRAALRTDEKAQVLAGTRLFCSGTVSPRAVGTEYCAAVIHAR